MTAMKTAVQKSALPTRKLAVGSSVAAIVGTQLSPAVAEVWPQVVPGVLAGPAVTEIVAALMALIAALVVGYWVPDAPNEAVE
jgi:hypothetical protein